jgi:hypothetical protein
MSDNPEANNQAPEVSAEVEDKKAKHPLGCYGKRNPNAVIEERQRRLYRRQLEGLTTRQLVLDHASRESISEKTAWMDWRVVSKWNEEDWQKDREAMLSRLQGMRLRLINKAISKGNLQVAMLGLKDLGAHLGEAAIETQAAIGTPSLSIVVEDKRQA